MDITTQELLELIKNSHALKQKPKEQKFWEDKAKGLSAEERSRLAEILSKESQKAHAIEDQRLTNEIKINEQYLNELTEIKQKKIPQMVKKIEEKSRAKENPEGILDQLNDV